MAELPAEVVRAVADAMEAEDDVRTFFTFSAMAKVALAALAEHGLVVVARADLAETIDDSHAYDVEYRIDLDRPSAGARLDRLRAALSGTLHPPQSPESVSAPPATHGHAGTPPNPSSTRTSPHVRTRGPIENPRNENS